MGISICIVAVGIALSWILYSRSRIETGREPDPLARLQPDLFSLVGRKFFVDEFYQATVVRWHQFTAFVSDVLDRWLWQGLVRLVAYIVIIVSWIDRCIDEGVLNFGFNRSCGGFRGGSKLLSLLQNGQAQRYLRLLAFAIIIFALVFLWGCA
jgi:NADH-quinone oxidoreductase subunit L